MEGKHNPNQLIVEGPDDLFAIVGLMRSHVDWPEGPGSIARAPVFVYNGNGATEILKDGFLSVFLRNPVLRATGIVLDADTAPKSRYQSIRAHCLGQFPDLPPELPKDGLVVQNSDRQRLGVWVMPDNASDGSLETFLKFLVPAPRGAAWSHAEQSVLKARELGCPCHETHLEKANLYTWLAWQNPPGQGFGVALSKKILDPLSLNAEPFVKWFIELYQLPPKSRLFN